MLEPSRGWPTSRLYGRSVPSAGWRAVQTADCERCRIGGDGGIDSLCTSADLGVSYGAKLGLFWVRVQCLLGMRVVPPRIDQFLRALRCREFLAERGKGLQCRRAFAHCRVGPNDGRKPPQDFRPQRQRQNSQTSVYEMAMLRICACLPRACELHQSKLHRLGGIFA